MKILLCGGGNAVHVLTSYIGSQPDCEVSVWTSFVGEAQKLQDAVDDKDIQCINDVGDDVYGKPVKIAQDPADVVPGSDMIILALPAFAHETYLKAMAPYIKRSGVIIGALPAEGGFDMCVRDAFGGELANQCVIFATETLPWACRIQTYGRVVEVLGTKKDIDLAVTPLGEFKKVSALLTSLVGPSPMFRSAGSFLSVTLMNINSIWHPTITYGQYRNWDDISLFDEPPLFYQGTDEFTGEKLALISEEVLQIKQVLLTKYPKLDLQGVHHVQDWMIRSYGADIGDTTSIKTMLHSNKGYMGLLHPMTKNTSEDGTVGYLPNFNYRYMTEDVPCGLVVTRGIAELLGVPTPNLDQVLVWSQKHSNKEYLVNGQLVGKDICDTRCPQRYGFTSVDDFMLKNRYIE